MANRTAPTNARSPTIVVIQFRVALNRQELVKAFTPDAPQIAKVPGLVWKYWTLDESTRSFAGVYLFESAARARDYLEGPVPAQLRASPDFSDVRAQAYPVLEDLSRITRAPLDVPAKPLEARSR